MASWFIGNYHQWFDAFERTLEIDLTNGNAYNMLAYTYSHIYDYQKAISTIKKYLALQPHVWNPYDSAFDIYMNAGHYDDALQICEEALKQNPGWSSSYSFYLYQGYRHLFKGEEEKARENIRRDMYSHLDLGKMFAELNQYSKALKEFSLAEKISGQVYRSGFNPLPVIADYFAGIAIDGEEKGLRPSKSLGSEDREAHSKPEV